MAILSKIGVSKTWTDNKYFEHFHFLNLGFFLPIENYLAQIFFLLNIFPITLEPLQIEQN